MQAIGYVRVSTDRQAEQGVSLEAQEAKIRAMAMVQGVELAEVIVDGGESGKKMNRIAYAMPGSRPNSFFAWARFRVFCWRGCRLHHAKNWLGDSRAVKAAAPLPWPGAWSPH